MLFVIFIIWRSQELVLRDDFCIVLKEVKYRALLSLPSRFDCIFLTSQTSSEDVSLENEWLDFLSLRVKVVG